MSEPPVIVSACLLGVKCRYDGTDAYHKELAKESALFIPVCPEQLAGLPTPRARAEITKGTGKDVLHGPGKVIDADGMDISKNFIQGAKEVLRIARLTGAKRAILKEKSPSCGVEFIKRGNESKEGPGVTTALLIEKGIDVRGL